MMSNEATKSRFMGISAGETKKDYSERLFDYAEMVKEFLDTIPTSPEYHTIITHLSKSAVSLSTRNNEKLSVSSKTDLINNPVVALRYLRESDCWLRITKRHVKEINTADLEYLIKESGELKGILNAIVQKSQ
jgi:four helix bundle protein